MSTRGWMTFAAIVLTGVGARQFYLTVNYGQATDCGVGVSAAASSSFANLRGCGMLNDAGISLGPDRYVPVVADGAGKDSVWLFAHVVGSPLPMVGPIAGRVGEGSVAARLAIGNADLPLPRAFHFRIVELESPPSGVLSGAILVAGLAIFVALFASRIGLAPVARKQRPTSAPAHPAIETVDVSAAASARKRFHIATWTLTPVSYAPAALVLLIPVSEFPGGDGVRTVVFLTAVVGFVVVFRRLVTRIPGDTGRTVQRASTWGAVTLVLVGLFIWSLSYGQAGFDLIMLAVLCVIIAVAAEAIAELNGYAEPKLGLVEGELLRSYGRRPGMFASGNYAAVVLWGAIAVVTGIVGVGFAVAVVAIDYISPINFARKTFVPRIVKPLLFHASRAGQRRRRYGSPSAREAMQNDGRAPILLLRSFADDDMVGRAEGEWLRPADTFEEVLADQLWSFGPVVAIGQPGERIPRAGAAREYVSHEDWKARVHTLADNAALIVLLVGSTPGLAWEFENTQRTGRLRKSLLVLPPNLEADPLRRYLSLRENIVDADVRAVLPERLPTDAMAVVFRDDRPVALTAGERSARSYEEAVAVAARSILAGHITPQATHGHASFGRVRAPRRPAAR